jgi:hypothetical protein
MQTINWYALPVGIWVGGHLLAQALGFAMEIPWSFYQLLDRPWLSLHPLPSLCALHSQPPGLNALLAAVLGAARATGISPEALAHGMFACVELVELTAVFHLVLRMVASPSVAAAGVVAVIANPGHHVFTHLFFYEALVAALLILMLVAAHGYLRNGGTARLAGTAAVLVAISSLRSLFHPLWAIGLCVLLVIIRAASVGSERRATIRGGVPVLCLMAVLSAAWPLKNALVFGHFTGASMSAFSVSRGVPGCHPASALARVPPGEIAETLARAERWCGETGRDPIAAAKKREGLPNWNHLTNLVMAPHLIRCAADWRRQNPGAWLRRAMGQYAMWTRPTFVHPYEGTLWGPASDAYRRYADGYRSFFFADLRPWIEPATPRWFLHDEARIRGRAVPYTLFGFVVLPALVIAVLVQAWARPWAAQSAIVIIALLCLLWPMIGACLSDGQEGNRMRASSEAVLVVLAAWVLPMADIKALFRGR